MKTYLVSSIAGRVAVVLCAFGVLLPYLLRRNRFSVALGFSQQHAAPYLHRLWPHFWLGYLALGLSTVHAFTAAMARANSTGVWAATAAWLLLMLEVMLGLSLQNVQLAGRKSVRRLHFWNMVAFVVLLTAHLWLNGA
jgi:hypothetical protein